jgi:hypothetical protein
MKSPEYKRKTKKRMGRHFGLTCALDAKGKLSPGIARLRSLLAEGSSLNFETLLGTLTAGDKTIEDSILYCDTYGPFSDPDFLQGFILGLCDEQNYLRKAAREKVQGALLCKRVAEINPLDIPVISREDDIPRKEQARLTRELFANLGLKGISVTTPNYSMASGVHIHVKLGATSSDRKILDRLELFLDVAFPGLVDPKDNDPCSDGYSFQNWWLFYN